MPPSGVYNVFELSSGSVVSLTTNNTTVSIAASTGAAIASVIATTSGIVLQASNTSRKGLIAQSCTGSGAPALVAYSTTPTTTSFSVIVTAGSYWEMPVPLFSGAMGVAVSTANTGLSATLLVTELS